MTHLLLLKDLSKIAEWSGQCVKVRAWDAGTRRWCFDVGKSLLGSRMPVEKEQEAKQTTCHVGG